MLSRQAIVETPIAGPDRLFRDNVKQAIASLEEHFEANAEAMVEEVIQLYEQDEFRGVDSSSARLKWQDQQQLRQAIELVSGSFHNHPLYPYKKTTRRA